jgi:urease accessory protein
MSWHAHLQLHYRLDAAGGTTAHDRHEGPLRVLQRLYPEGPRVCHHVLVHPPGGIVGGDVLDIDARLDAGTHALITTPGATRFYRSAGDEAVQSARVVVDSEARLEWLPLETIAYSGCIARNALRFELAPGAQMIGWDVVALGLPAAGEAFERGRFRQEIALPGLWLERGILDAGDRLLMESPLGLAGHRVLATLWLAGGSPMSMPLRDRLLEAARAVAEAEGPGLHAGCTSPQAPLVVLRVLADRVEPALRLLTRVRAAWRLEAWQLQEHAPRVWRT